MWKEDSVLSRANLQRSMLLYEAAENGRKAESDGGLRAQAALKQYTRTAQTSIMAFRERAEKAEATTERVKLELRESILASEEQEEERQALSARLEVGFFYPQTYYFARLDLGTNVLFTGEVHQRGRFYLCVSRCPCSRGD